MHFVLGRLTQRLDRGLFHVLGKAAHVVMRLDDLGFSGLDAGGFDDIGVDIPLGEERAPFGFLPPLKRSR